MPKIAPLPALKLIKILEKKGFRTARQKGSHVVMINARGVRIVVPVHRGKNVKSSLMRTILNEACISRDEYFQILDNL